MNVVCKSLVVLGLACLTAATAAAAETSSKKSSSTSKHIVAVFRLRAPIVEKPASEMLLFGGEHQPTSLKDIVRRMNKARDDASVKAVVVLLEDASLGTAQAEELRQAMVEINKSGKSVYAHADSLSMHDYVLLSAATHVSVAPTGDLWLTGLYAESMYLRGLLNKLGVKPDFLTCGDYKSAAEMFMRESPSPKAEEMENWLLDSVYGTQLKLIAGSRGVDEAKVRGWVDGGPYTANKARDLGIIDAVEQRQDIQSRIKRRFGDDVKFEHHYGESSRQKVDFSSPFAAFEVFGELLGGGKKKVHKTSVAIVYVDGPIMLGASEQSPFSSESMAGSSNLRRALDDAAADDTIKAVVLRINSPGGSATASDIILDATRRVKAKKPLVVSMGSVAASGGYYVSCAADTVFADEATITGSIGVVGGKLATTDMWKKIGVTFKEYPRGKHAGLLSSATVFSPEERTHMQAWMDEIYDVFKGHVTTARGKKLKKPIDELAGGRVYTGKQALDLGLVDKIGSLEDAIKFAATEAKLGETYELRVVPEPKNFFELLLEENTGDHESEKRLDAGLLGGQPDLLKAVLPLLGKLDPQRAAALRLALLRLDMIHAEGVVLMAPELLIGR